MTGPVMSMTMPIADEIMALPGAKDQAERTMLGELRMRGVLGAITFEWSEAKIADPEKHEPMHVWVLHAEATQQILN